LRRDEGVIEFRILGPFEVSKSGERLEVGVGKQRALLLLLLLHGGEVVSTDRLIDALWDERPPASALNSVHVYVSQLRKALGNGRLETRGRGYLLTLEPEELDLGRFERLLREGRELLAIGEPDRAANALRSALELWRGSPLPDVASEAFAQGEIARIEELRLAALEERIEADLILGRHTELVPELERLVREHPLQERLRAQLMLALYRSGRQSEALETYQQARRLFSSELGLEPSRALRELEAAILRQDVELDLAPKPAGRRGQARRKRRVALAIGAVVLAAATVALVGMTFTGRRASPPEVLPNSLVRIDPETLAPTDVIHIGDAPDLVVLAGGFAWVTHHVLRDTPSGALRNAGDRTLTRVDLSTGEPRVVGGGLAPCGLAADPSGDVWVANCYQRGSGAGANVVRVDAATLEFDAGPWRVPSSDDFYRGLTYGGGSLWLSQVADGSCQTGLPCRPDPRVRETVTEIDPQTGKWHSIPLARSVSPLAWSEGYGHLWMSNFDVGSVSRLHTEAELVDETVDRVGVNPGHLVVGGDSVWVADWSSPQVVRLHAVGPPRPRHIPLPVKQDTGVWNVAAGAGAVWATTARDHTLWRIDPKTYEPTAITMPYFPTGLAADDDNVWVTVRAR
jgi:DNA-binding SARP family transcriptional activator/streptogramin lyase